MNDIMEIGNDKVIYHYTSLNTFFNIIKEQQFKLFDITKSNDPLEGRFAINALKKAAHNLYRSNEINQKQYFCINKCFSLFMDEISSSERLSQVYVCSSFCESPQNIELAFWRAYGDNGRGIAIGFSSKMLKEFSQKNNMRFKKITYYSDEEMEKTASEFWIKNIEIISDEISEEEFELSENLKAIMFDYYENGYFIKHNANEYEREYRLLYKCSDLDNFLLPNISKPVRKEIDFIAAGDDLKINFAIPVSVDKDDNLKINNIIIGSLCKVTTNEIRMLLNKYNMVYFGVDKSRIQMR